nr:MAG TPA: hypothetical protein [Caudoviricetes sp.]
MTFSKYSSPSFYRLIFKYFVTKTIYHHFKCVSILKVNFF